MSVFFFGKAELANIAKVLFEPWEEEGNKKVLRQLQQISKANAAAFNSEYAKEREPEYDPRESFDSWEIWTERDENTKPGDLKQALRTAGLLHYNCCTNDGTDHSTADEREAIREILTQLVFKAAEAIRP